jgi:iron complex transport system substrate-binding protein
VLALTPGESASACAHPRGRPHRLCDHAQVRTSALAVLALVLTGAPAAARTVTDDSGRAVSVPTPPLRIVSLAPGATETLFAAGAGAQIVATVEYSDEPEAARRITRIGDVAAVDLERLVVLHPDVIVAWPGGGNPAQREKLLRLGIPLYDQQVGRLSEIPASVRRLGILAGTGESAERAARAIEAHLAALRATYRGGTHDSVLLQVWNRPIYTVGGRQLMSDALATCGARNVFGDLPEASPVVDIEAVIARDPDIIVVAAPPGEGAAWLEDWRRFPALKAVRSGRLLLFKNQALSRLGPSVIEATDELCRALARPLALTRP